MGNTLVIATVATAVGSNEAKKLIDGKGLQIQPVLGGFVLGLFLFALTAANDKLAARFCALIIVTSILMNGTALFATLQKVYNKAGTTPASSAQSATTGGSTGKGTSGGGGGGGGGGGI